MKKSRVIFKILISLLIVVFSLVFVSFIFHVIIIKTNIFSPTEKNSNVDTKKHGNVQSLKSNFGINEYRCTGSCYCGTERRNSIPLVSRGFSTLLAALTMVVAFKKAKEYFTDECKEKFSESCKVESITAEVDECTKKESSSTEEEENDAERSFWCSGKCKINKLHLEKTESSDTPFDKKIVLKNNFYQKCVDIESSGSVDVFTGESPEKKFQETVLRKTCLEEGIELNIQVFDKVFGAFTIEGLPPENGEKMKENFRNTARKKENPEAVSLCVESNPPDHINSSIKCELIRI